MESHTEYRSAYFYAMGRNHEPNAIKVTLECFAKEYYLDYLLFMLGKESNYCEIKDYYMGYVNSLLAIDELINV